MEKTIAFRDYNNVRAEVSLSAVRQADGRLTVRRFEAFVTAGCRWRADRGFEKFGGATRSIRNEGNSFSGEVTYGPSNEGLVSGSVRFSGRSETKAGQPRLVGTVSMTATGTSYGEGEEPQTCEWGPIRFTAVPPDKVPPRITRVSVRPNPFHVVKAGNEDPDPSDGGVAVRYRLSEPADVTVEFKRTSQKGCGTRGPICSESFSAYYFKGGQKRLYWNGRGGNLANARPIRSGTYRVTIRARDAAGNKASVTRTVKASG